MKQAGEDRAMDQDPQKLLREILKEMKTLNDHMGRLNDEVWGLRHDLEVREASRQV